MICPICGELTNYIDDDNIECYHYQWSGDIVLYNQLIEKES
jgi:hypothetical protein